MFRSISPAPIPASLAPLPSRAGRPGENRPGRLHLVAVTAAALAAAPAFAAPATVAASGIPAAAAAGFRVPGELAACEHAADARAAPPGGRLVCVPVAPLADAAMAATH
ncbi:hypothetical protein [Caldovatus aquaticus]|uniref:Uncharacterized protein n=1 Tax=Caldovatus aquaticus TaxID=2865671 RepID=A0ABS7F6G1_9PROT|nr:hypothetical protein [Caldovatus aquaticus]MBW8271205.1 hypothetical protein [Caldovatus aquaticus]